MASSTSREKAAQAWGTPETSEIEMDSKLAEAFAEILDEIYKKPIKGIRDGLIKVITGELNEKSNGYQDRVHTLVLSFAITQDRM